MARGPNKGKALKLAAYFVALRQSERRILRDALYEFGSARAAAAALGITRAYFTQRSIHLGGVLPDQPVREPPGPLAHARANARAEGIEINEAMSAPRRFGKLLNRKKPTIHDSISIGDDPVHGVRSATASPPECGAEGSELGEATDGGEDHSE